MTGTAALDWRRVAAFGMTWAVVAPAMEGLGLPLGVISAADLLRFLAQGLLQQFPMGIVLACMTMLIERRPTLLRMGVALIGFALLTSTSLWAVRLLAIPIRAWQPGAAYVYTIGTTLVYGGLFMAAYHLGMRSERTRALLGRAEIGRQQSEAQLGLARLHELQGHVEPAFLLRVMTEVQRRYATDPLAMARLLDALVDFLRAAMPGVRGGSSTLLAELSLATLYVKVRSELEPGRHTWAIHTDGPTPDLPCPALMLLPVLDQLAAVDAADMPRTVLRVSQANGHCTLTIDHSGARAGSWFPAELLHRLQVGLRASFGDAWTLAVHDRSPGRVLVLTMPAVRAVSAPSFSQPNGGYPWLTQPPAAAKSTTAIGAASC